MTRRRPAILALAAAALLSGCGATDKPQEPRLLPDGSQAPASTEYVGRDIVSISDEGRIRDLTAAAVKLCGDRGYTLAFDTARYSGHRIAAVCRGTEPATPEREPRITELDENADPSMATIEAVGRDLCGARGYSIEFDSGQYSDHRIFVVCL